MRAVLVQPPAENRLTGGYLYNLRIAAEVPGLALVESDEPAAVAADLLLLDSLFLARPLDARLRGRRLLWLLHGLPTMFAGGGAGPSPSREELESLAVGQGVIATGAALARRLVAAGYRGRVDVCEAGTDPVFASLARPPRAPGAPLRVLSVGTVGAVKGYDVAAAALASLPGAGERWRWRIVGAPGDSPPPALAELAGPVAPSHMPAEYAAADLFLLSSRSEGAAPMALREALASGLPVVATDVGDARSLLSATDAGIIVPPADPAALAAALATLLADAPLRARMSAAARALGARLPTWRHTGDGVQLLSFRANS